MEHPSGIVGLWGTGGAPLPEGDWVWVNGLWTHPVLSLLLSSVLPPCLSFCPTVLLLRSASHPNLNVYTFLSNNAL